MRPWLVMLGGMIVWTAHFLGVYLAASIFPGSSAARWGTAIITLIAMMCIGFLLKRSIALLHQPGGDALGPWMAGIATAANILALVAIAYQALPAIFA